MRVKRLIEWARGLRGAVVLQVAGVVTVSGASFAVSPVLGGFVAGSAMVLFGVALERD